MIYLKQTTARITGTLYTRGNLKNNKINTKNKDNIILTCVFDTG